MIPFYWEASFGNFGDDLNLVIWDHLLPGFREVSPEVLLVGIGTVLNADLLPPGRKLVIGSGFGYGTAPDLAAGDFDVRCVRGPLTAARLHLDRDKAIVDPAVFVPEMPAFSAVGKDGRTIFIPHWESAVAGVWDSACRMAGIDYVDPCGPFEQVIRRIAAADLVLAESMHAAIIADAFRVPFVPVSTADHVNIFKWNDWAASLGLTLTHVRIPVSTRAEARSKAASFWGRRYEKPQAGESGAGTGGAERPSAGAGLRRLVKSGLAAPAALALRKAARAEPLLSSDGRLEEARDRFRAVLEGVRGDYGMAPR